jgi:hypothetical protein
MEIVFFKLGGLPISLTIKGLLFVTKMSQTAYFQCHLAFMMNLFQPNFARKLQFCSDMNPRNIF